MNGFILPDNDALGRDALVRNTSSGQSVQYPQRHPIVRNHNSMVVQICHTFPICSIFYKRKSVQ